MRSHVPPQRRPRSKSVAKSVGSWRCPRLPRWDFNISPDESGVIKNLVAKGLIVDVPVAFGHGNRHNFARDGPLEGIEGHGETRIDTVLANKAGFAIVKGCRLRWARIATCYPYNGK